MNAVVEPKQHNLQMYISRLTGCLSREFFHEFGIQYKKQAVEKYKIASLRASYKHHNRSYHPDDPADREIICKDL